MSKKQEPNTRHSPEAERGVLGALLLDPSKIPLIRELLSAGDFYLAKYGLIYGAILALADIGQTPDPILLCEHLAGKAEIDASELIDLARDHPRAENWATYAAIVRRDAGYRRLLAETQAFLVQLGKADKGIDPDILADEHAKRLRAAAPTPIVCEQRKTVWTIAELLAAQFPEPRWAIPGLLPAGLCFLAGRPKVGKSFLALQIAHAVATGGIVFDRKVEKGRVLFIALEDSDRRLQRRIQTHKIEEHADLTIVTDWPTFGQGGIAQVHDWIARYDLSLVVVDTLSRAAGRADQLDLTEMTMLNGELQRVSMSTDATILVNDHHTKPKGYANNPIDDLMGSTGKSAVADVLMGLYKEQGKHTATLMIVGRDIEEQELSLRWDGLTCCWQLVADTDGVQKDSVSAKVLQAIEDLARMNLTPTTTRIAQKAGKDKSQISHVLGDLAASGLVIQGEKIGKEVPYSLPGE